MPKGHTIILPEAEKKLEDLYAQQGIIAEQKDKVREQLNDLQYQYELIGKRITYHKRMIRYVKQGIHAPSMHVLNPIKRKKGT